MCISTCHKVKLSKDKTNSYLNRRVGGGGSKGSNELPLEVNNGGLKTQTVNFQLLANTGGMENKLRALQLLNYPPRRR